MKREINAKKVGVIMFLIVAMITVISVIYPKTNIQKINAEINKAEASNSSQYRVEVFQSNYVYDGYAWEPSVKVYKNNQLVSKSNYKTYYYNNIDAGTASVYVYGNKNDWWAKTTFNIIRDQIYVYPKITTKQYGQTNPEITYTYSKCPKGVPKFAGSLGTNASTYSNVGTYDVTKGNLRLVDNGEFKAKNYDLIISNYKGRFVINRADISNIVSTSVYANFPEWTYYGIAFHPSVSIKGLKINKDFWLLYSSRTNFKDVGEHYIYVYGMGNYTGYRIVKVKINPKDLIITPVSLSKNQGQANPELRYTYFGNVSGETPRFTGGLRTTATINSKAGSYKILQNNLQLRDYGNFKASNYKLQIKEGVLRVVSVNSTVNNEAKNVLNLNYSVNSDFPNKYIVAECGGIVYKRPTQLVIKDGNYTLVNGKDYIITDESLVYNIINTVYSRYSRIYQATYTVKGIGKYNGEKLFKVETQTL